VFRGEPVVLIVHAAATWFLVGLIWTIQLVHYALFDGVGENAWGEYHRRHTSSITLIVGPLMLVELLTAIWLVWRVPTGVATWLPWVGLGLIALIWLSTMFVQIPMHNTLAGGHDADLARRLTASNWIRTVAWSARGILVGWMLLSLLRRS
jgi:hypothetical protein